MFCRAFLAHSTYIDQGIRGCPVPNIKSQIKRVKTNEKSRQRNKAVKSALRTYVRNFRRGAEAGDVEAAENPRARSVRLRVVERNAA